MKFKDQFRFVRSNMKKNKTRIFMTILATAMGCAFLIVLASVAFGLQKSVVSDVTQGRLMTEIQVFNEKGVTLDDIEYLQSVDHVKAVTRRQFVEQNVNYILGEYKGNGSPMAVDFPSEIKSGFELSKGRLPKAKNEIIVGYNFVENLAKWKDGKPPERDEDGRVPEDARYDGTLLNKKMNLEIKGYDGDQEKTKQFEVTIVGIGKEPTKEWEQNQDVLISENLLSEFETFTGTRNGMLIPPDAPEAPDLEIPEERMYNQVKIFADNAENVEGISQTVKEKGFSTYSVVNELKQMNLLFLIAKSGLIFIGTIAILIASIGIYNTMTMAVTERAPDIGIMKAIGANPATIKKIFLLESSYIGILGALFGTIVAYGISYGVNLLLPIILGNAFGEKPPEDFMFSYIPLILPLICIGICLGVTILSGLRPANRATKVDVLKAMRREV